MKLHEDHKMLLLSVVWAIMLLLYFTGAFYLLALIIEWIFC